MLPAGLDPASVDAVAMDLDGTILDRTFHPSPRMAAAVARCEALGIRCVIATGRMFVSARRVAHEIGVTQPIVCYQGAMVGDPAGGEILSHRPVATDLAREILSELGDEARKTNLYLDDELYVWEENAETLRYKRTAGVEMHVVGDLARWITRPTTKIVTVGEPSAMDALRDRLQPLFGDRAFVAKSLPIFLEFAAPGVNKATGLEVVADRIGIPADRWAAIGDAENDLEMLDWAGAGIAMGNADPHVKDHAGYTIGDVEDGGVPAFLDALADARG